MNPRARALLAVIAALAWAACERCAWACPACVGSGTPRTEGAYVATAALLITFPLAFSYLLYTLVRPPRP